MKSIVISMILFSLVVFCGMGYAQKTENSANHAYPRFSVEPFFGISAIDGGDVHDFLEILTNPLLGTLIVDPDGSDIYHPLSIGVRTDILLMDMKSSIVTLKCDGYLMYDSDSSNKAEVHQMTHYSGIFEPGIAIAVPSTDLPKTYYTFFSIGASCCYTQLSFSSSISMESVSVKGKSYNGTILEYGGTGTGTGLYAEVGFKIPVKKLLIAISVKYRRADIPLSNQSGGPSINFGMSGWLLNASVKF